MSRQANKKAMELFKSHLTEEQQKEWIDLSYCTVIHPIHKTAIRFQLSYGEIEFWGATGQYIGWHIQGINLAPSSICEDSSCAFDGQCYCLPTGDHLLAALLNFLYDYEAFIRTDCSINRDRSPYTSNGTLRRVRALNLIPYEITDESYSRIFAL